MTKLIKGVNDLATLRPDLASEWHPTKNGNLTPQDVTCGSDKKVWWLLHYDDPNTKKHFNFEWESKICHRNNGANCPYLNHTKIYNGFNDLATINPQLAKEWHPTKNNGLKPTNVFPNSRQKVWWYLPYDTEDGRHFDFEWQATIAHRNNGSGCPFLENHQVWRDFNDLATINPQLASEWHPTKNGNLIPQDVTSNSNKKVWWYLPYDTEDGRHFDFEWQAVICNRNRGNSCPFLNNNKLFKGFNDLKTINPQLASEWHPTKNGNLTPQDVTCGSEKTVWWLLSYDDPRTGKHFDFEWQAKIYSRNEGANCPFLDTSSNPKLWKGFNDLKTRYPKLASEWHPTKNGNLTPSDVTCGSKKKVWWLLPYDDPKTGKHFDFEWKSSIYHRVNGTNCPYLTSSKTEVLLYDLMKKHIIKFVAEQKFSDCKYKSYLPFDLYLPNGNIIIECDGIQHFESIKFFGGKKHLMQTQKHDNIKNEYCKVNNIALLRIPYTYDPIVDKDKIENMVLDFIKTKKVPQEILDFYSQYKFSNYAQCINKLNND